MNLKSFTMLFGVVLLVVGVAGYVPALNPGGLLLGFFQVDGLHNVVHLATGAAALAAAMMGGNTPRMFFQVFGVVYGLVTVLGFVTGHGLGMLVPVNMADNLLHAAITALALYLGFGTKAK